MIQVQAPLPGSEGHSLSDLEWLQEASNQFFGDIVNLEASSRSCLLADLRVAMHITRILKNTKNSLEEIFSFINRIGANYFSEDYACKVEVLIRLGFTIEHFNSKNDEDLNIILSNFGKIARLVEMEKLSIEALEKKIFASN